MKKCIKLIALVLTATLVSLLFAGCNKQIESNVKVLDVELTSEDYAFAVKKGDTTFKTAANELLAEIKTDGRWDALYEKYLLTDDTTNLPGEPILAKRKSTNRANELVVATNAEFPPYEYVKGEGFGGLDMALAKMLADKMGRELVVLNIAFDAVVTSVTSDDADIGMAGLTITDERKKNIDFTDPYSSATQVVVVRTDDTSFDDIDLTADDAAKKIEEKITENSKKKGWAKKYEIGTQSGTTGFYYAAGEDGFEGFGKKVKAIGYDSGSLAIQDLMQGRLDIVILDVKPAKSIVAKLNK